MSRPRIIVGGFLGLFRAGGVTWDYVQYPAGLAAMGCDVYYVEDTRLWPTYQEAGSEGAPCGPNVGHLAAVMEAFGLKDRWSYVDEASGGHFGLGRRQLREICRTADILLNISCSTVMRDEYRAIPVRALIDSDPMFTQIQAETEVSLTPGPPVLRELIRSHTHHFTFGEQVGQPGCRVPGAGIRWQPTRQPICLDHWPAAPLPLAARPSLTTVMNWTAARPLEYAGESWGQKDVELRRLAALPRKVPEVQLSLAVGQTAGAPFPADDFRALGWQILDPNAIAPDWRSYRRFIQDSAGEFSVAKEAYVKGGTGWFSCRSACYLASGRPAVVQDTGWTAHLPSGEGLLAFRSEDEAVDALRQLCADWPRHARRARAVAEEHFDSGRVLGALVARCESTPIGRVGADGAGLAAGRAREGS